MGGKKKKKGQITGYNVCLKIFFTIQWLYYLFDAFELFKYRDAHKLRLDRNNQKFNYRTLREEKTEAEITDSQRKYANLKLLETWRLRNEAGFH